MNKKGQVYIIGAVIISVMIFALVVVSNKAEQSALDKDFKRLSENYNLEASRFLNKLFELDNPVLLDSFAYFTLDFSTYSRSQNPTYELFFIFALDNELLIGNLLSHKIELYNTDGGFITEVAGCYGGINSEITFGGLSFQGGYNSLSGFEDCFESYSYIPEKVIICIINTDSSSRDTCYPFKVTPGKPQIMIVSGQTEGEQRQVFIGGEGFIPEEAIIEGDDQDED
ncbi:MAG: hypothetical protein AABW49_04725 [Nanoarchaeota archaeon]